METIPDHSPSADHSPLAELARIRTDPAHPLHAGFLRNDPQVRTHLEGLYTRHYGSAMVQFGPRSPLDESTTGTAPPIPPDEAAQSPEERVAQHQVEETLRHTFGDDYETIMFNARIGAGHMFENPETTQALEHLSTLVTSLGPEAEVHAVRFLSQVGQLHTQRRSMR